MDADLFLKNSYSVFKKKKKLFERFTHSSIYFSSVKSLNYETRAKDFLFFIKNKGKAKKKKNFFYFKTVLKNKKNLFFNSFSFNFNFLNKKINNLLKITKIFSTNSNDLFFLFSNPLFIKSYNYFNNQFLDTTGYVVSYYAIHKKIQINTNLFTDMSLFSFNFTKEIFHSIDLKRIKSAFSFLPYETIIKFIEYCSGKKVVFKIDPFIFKSLAVEDEARCLM